MVRQPRAALAALIALGVLVAGCSEEPAQASLSPAEQLAAARTVLDESPSVSVRLTGDGLPSTGTVLVSGQGTAAHPASFEGDLRVSQSGLAVTVPVVSVDGTVWAQLPLTDTFTEVDLATFGVGDPGRLIDTEEGVSQLLTADPEPVALGQVRVDEEVLEEFEVELPGELVGSLLTIADPAATVTGRFAVTPETAQLRQAVLTGPFYAGGEEQSYTLVLDDYGAEADIRAPSG